MPPTGDNIIEVGAVIDLNQIIPGLQELVAKTQIATEQMQASLATLDKPVTVGAIAPTPEAAGIDITSIGNLGNTITDLQLKSDQLKASIGEMYAEIEKAGSTAGVKESWTKRLAVEELGLAQVTDTLTTAERTKSAATEVIVNQEQLLAAIRRQLGVATAEEAANEQGSVGALAAATTSAAANTTVTERQRAAKAELKDAEKEYKAAVEESNVAYASGGDATAANAKVEEAKTRLVAAQKESAAAEEEEEAATAKNTATKKDQATVIGEQASATQINTGALNTGTEAAADNTTAQTDQASATSATVGAATSAAAAHDAQATSAQKVTGATTAVGAAARLGNQQIKDLAQSLMAGGNSADQASRMLIQAGISTEKVNASFKEMGISIGSIKDPINQSNSALLTMLTQQKAAGAELGGLARSAQLFGASGKETATALQQLGFSGGQIATKMAELGIKMTGSKNSLLELAAASGATNEELQNLERTIQQVTRATNTWSERNGIARVELAALNGSTGMMMGGLARLAAASQTLAPIMTAIFPLFAAIAFIDILRQISSEFGKLSDTVEGYTEEVKKAEQANIKASEAMAVHASSIQEAYQKLGEQTRTSAELAGESWFAAANKGVETARLQSNEWISLIPIVSQIHDLYIGITGALNGVEDAANRAAKATQNTVALHGQIVENLIEQNKHNLKVFETEQATANVGKTRVTQLQQELSALAEKDRREQTIADNEAALKRIQGTAGSTAQEEARKRVAQENAEQRKDIEAKLRVALLEEQIAMGKALEEAERTTQLARLTQAERFAQEEYQLGHIGLDREITDLRNIEQQKYETQRAGLEQRKRLAEAEAGTGKNTAPQVRAINAEIEKLETDHQTNMTGLNARQDEERRRLDETYARTVISGELRVANEQINNRKEALKVMFEDNAISEATYTNLLLENENKRNVGVEDALRKRRETVLKYTNVDQQKTALKEIDDEERVEVQRHQADIEQIKAASQRRQNEEERRNLTESLANKNAATNEAIRNTNRELEEQLRITDKLQSEGLLTFNQRTAQNLQLNEQEHQKALAILEAAIAYEQQQKAAALSTTAQEAAEKKIAELTREREKLDDQYAERKRRIEQELADDMVRKQQQAMNVISSSFTSAFDRMLTEHVRFNTIMAQFWDHMVQGWAKMGLDILGHFVQTMAQIVLQAALTELRINLIHAQGITFREALQNLWTSILAAFGIKQTTQATTQAAAESAAKIAANAKDVTQATITQTAITAATTAGVAARMSAETGATIAITALKAAARQAEATQTAATDVGEVVSLAAVGAAGAAAAAAPAGPAAMEAAATTADALILAYAAQAAVVAEKGTGPLPHDTLGFLHKNETVLPANLSLGIKGAIENTGGLGATPINIPEGLAAPAGGNTSTSSVTNVNKTFHIAPQISVSNVGGEKMSLDDIAEGVHTGIRRGLINLRGAL